MSEVKRSDERNLDHYVKFLQDQGLTPNTNIRIASRDRKHNNVRGEFAVADGMPAIYNGGISLRLSQMTGTGNITGDANAAPTAVSTPTAPPPTSSITPPPANQGVIFCPDCGQKLVNDPTTNQATDGSVICHGCGTHFTQNQFATLQTLAQGKGGSPQTPGIMQTANVNSKFKRVVSQINDPMLDSDDSGKTCPDCRGQLVPSGSGYGICSQCGASVTDQDSNTGLQTNDGPLVKFDLTKYQTPAQPALASASSKFKKVAQFGHESNDDWSNDFDNNGGGAEPSTRGGLESMFDDKTVACPDCKHPIIIDVTKPFLHCEHCGMHKDIPKHLMGEFQQTFANSNCKFKKTAGVNTNV